MNWTLYAYRKNIVKFRNQMVKFCNDKELTPTFKNFLYFDSDGYVPATYPFLIGAPKVYLANSKSFQDYFDKLDKDFQQDIYTKDELKNFRNTIRENDELRKYLKSIMRKDSIFN